ncbi:MAG TPA: hypothetical protein VFG30_40490 [Polyangiales bacterium]|nr:hypothetical protein [Polyangiales bacterium]
MSVAPQADHGYLAQLAWTIAAVALGYAVQLGNGHLNAGAIPMLTIALGLTTAVVVAPRVRSVPDGEVFVVSGLLVGLGFQSWHLLSTLPAIYIANHSDAAVEPFFQGSVAALVLSGVLAGAHHAKTRVIAMSIALGLHFALGVWLIHASPKPDIDTFVFQKEGVAALLSGNNPYRLFGYPYPPLCLLFATLGSLLGGDFRYSQLFAMTLAGALIAALGAWRRSATLAAMLLLFTPRGFFVLEQSWTEPYLVCLLAAVALSARRGLRATPWLTGLLLVVKQYMFVLMPLVWLLPRPASARNWRTFLGTAAISGAIVTLPFLLFGPTPFLRSVVFLQFLQPFRPDALSFPALWLSQGAEPLPEYVLFVVAACAIALALWRSPRTTAGFCGAVALTYLCFFAFAKQAFCNYYYFVIGALCCAIASATQRAQHFAATKVFPEERRRATPRRCARSRRGSLRSPSGSAS